VVFVCRRDELKTERLRVEALKWELARVTLRERTGQPMDARADTRVGTDEAARLAAVADASMVEA